jgi:hypothetical protein
MSALQLLDNSVFDAIDRKAFAACEPFPWLAGEGLLKAEAFAQLLRDFPPIEKFERHLDIPKVHGQRPHNRHYLAYERTLYDPDRPRAEGIITHAELAPSWQQFLQELEGDDYRGFIADMVGRDDFVMRYAWHIGRAGSEVSPHIDSENKIATHISYFNVSEEWSADWGGETIVLDGKRVAAMNPEFEDFERAVSIPFLDNRSFLFANNGRAWHGVRTLTCPPGGMRRLFNVIFEVPAEASRLPARIRSFLSARLPASVRQALSPPRPGG